MTGVQTCALPISSGTGVTSIKPILQTSTLDSISANDISLKGSIAANDIVEAVKEAINKK